MGIEKRNGQPVRVDSLQQLKRLADEKRAVVAPGTWLSIPKPAAVVLNQQGATIVRLMEHGLYVYQKQEVKKDFPALRKRRKAAL